MEARAAARTIVFLVSRAVPSVYCMQMQCLVELIAIPHDLQDNAPTVVARLHLLNAEKERLVGPISANASK